MFSVHVQHRGQRIGISHQEFTVSHHRGLHVIISPQEGMMEIAHIRNLAFGPHMGLHVLFAGQEGAEETTRIMRSDFGPHIGLM